MSTGGNLPNPNQQVSVVRWINMATTAPGPAAQKEEEEEQTETTWTAAAGDTVIPVPRDVTIYEQNAPITVNRGEVPFVVGGWDWVAQSKGKALAEALLSPDPLAYADRWLKEARGGFRMRQAEGEWDAFLTNGGLCGGRQLRWALMELPPHRTFKLHVHPVLEVIHIIRGQLHERRMMGPPLDLSADDGKAVAEMPPVDLSGEERAFVDGVFPEDCINVNEMGSVHQSWTEGEGCLLLCIWTGHLNIDTSTGKHPRGYSHGGSSCLRCVDEEERGGGAEDEG